ncbi:MULTISPECIES: hypothetical protein [unclassified Methylobacterium]|uniref:TadE/TadG family type IV pilus assembly protein n=1 Tax=unclassified Methylobacterium TaxID=2615210 RepID=UPI000B2825DF|nr:MULTISPECIES: hypothetical protein [unclassified Methylobacterium]
MSVSPAPVHPLARLLRSFGRETGGAVVIEFAMTATILLGLLAMVVDLSMMAGISRDVERSSTQIASLLASCPSGDCATKTIDWYYDRKVNALVQYPQAKVTLIQAKKVGGTMLPCTGRVTFIDPSVAAKASPVFAENDEGFIVVVEVAYLAFVPYTGALMTLSTATVENVTGKGAVFTSQTSAVRTSTGSASC